MNRMVTALKYNRTIFRNGPVMVKVIYKNSKIAMNKQRKIKPDFHIWLERNFC